MIYRSIVLLSVLIILASMLLSNPRPIRRRRRAGKASRASKEGFASRLTPSEQLSLALDRYVPRDQLVPDLPKPSTPAPAPMEIADAAPFSTEEPSELAPSNNDDLWGFPTGRPELCPCV